MKYVNSLYAYSDEALPPYTLRPVGSPPLEKLTEEQELEVEELFCVKGLEILEIANILKVDPNSVKWFLNLFIGDTDDVEEMDGKYKSSPSLEFIREMLCGKPIVQLE